MITKTELNDIRRLERWPIKFADFHRHYFYVIFPIAILFIGAIEYYSGLAHNMPGLKITAIITLGLGIFLLIFITHRLIQNQKFKNYRIKGVTAEIVQKSMLKFNLKEYDYKEEIGLFSGLTRPSGFSPGERITIILAGERILINSRPIMGPVLPQPITIYKDRNNIRNLIREIETATAIISK